MASVYAHHIIACSLGFENLSITPLSKDLSISDLIIHQNSEYFFIENAAQSKVENRFIFSNVLL